MKTKIRNYSYKNNKKLIKASEKLTAKLGRTIIRKFVNKLY